MSLPFSRWGSFSRSAGIYSALGKQAKLVNFSAAKKVTFSFDPFSDKQSVMYTRNALHYMNTQTLRSTNSKCIVKTEVTCDRAPPTIEIKLVDGSEILFKTQDLDTLEILTYFNRLVSAKAPKKEVATGPILQTKAEKAAASAGKRRR